MNRKSLDELVLMSPKELGRILSDTYSDTPWESEYIKDLLYAGADPNIDNDDFYGQTPLHYAIHDDIEIIKLLIEAGANLDARDNLEQTPLHYAVNPRYTPDIDVIRLLLATGADITALDEDDRTPWDITSSIVRSSIPQLNLNYNG